MTHPSQRASVEWASGRAVGRTTPSTVRGQKAATAEVPRKWDDESSGGHTGRLVRASSGMIQWQWRKHPSRTQLPGDDDGGGGNNSNNNNDDDDNDKYKRHASALWRAPRDARLSQGDSAVGFTMAMQFAPWTTSRRPKHLRHAWRPPTSSGRSTRYSGPGTACTAYIQAAGDTLHTHARGIEGGQKLSTTTTEAEALAACPSAGNYPRTPAPKQRAPMSALRSYSHANRPSFHRSPQTSRRISDRQAKGCNEHEQESKEGKRAMALGR
ncbi:uncharacterized protein SETTUDRAFT_34784 [Exserohilum turcica Et28A]|uniref:Uncharacterized protein n=1 Tax=Exserohilum turcicum (strain 28A) TaxID=671987 RepID=R0I957_EXST2|nr:uncharacterized protein SETTUDRAFT_34784 [Exserohilum turcica Et28A]EOA82030.1 hypothetical protein SETTUDRAFT_34784 [Exserohilum turcica Et28A]